MSEVTDVTTIIKSIRRDMSYTHAMWRLEEEASEGDKYRWRRVRENAVKRHHETKALATRMFAELNGWRVTHRCHGFNIHDLGRGKLRGIWLDSCGWCGDEFDHVQFFRHKGRPYRPAAIVTQPYNLTPDKLRRMAGKIGSKVDEELVWHVPPSPKASIHNPGSTCFFVLTRPGVVVTWLPEQLAGVAA